MKTHNQKAALFLLRLQPVGATFILVLLILMNVTGAIANRTVKGRVRDVNGLPLTGVKVEAWDSDVGADDKMGHDLTDANGYYSITYADGHWDPAPHNVTSWRPDIYIRVKMRGDNGNWFRVYTSSKHDNWKLRNDLTINVSTRGIPRVYGKVTSEEEDGAPVRNATVKVKDNDLPNPDDEMGTGTTDSEGKYSIQYSRKNWDSGTGRPDIFVRVYIGDAPKVSSERYNGYSMKNPLRIDLTIPKKEEPEPPSPTPPVLSGAGTTIVFNNTSGETRFLYVNQVYTDLIVPGATIYHNVPCGVFEIVYLKEAVTDTYNEVTWESEVIGACQPSAIVVPIEVFH